MCLHLYVPGGSTGIFHQNKTLGWLPWSLWQRQFGATVIVPGLETANISRNRQVMKSIWILSSAFPHCLLWILNIQVKPGHKTRTGPIMCWVLLIQLESSPLLNIYWQLASCHSLSMWWHKLSIGGFWHQKNLANASCLRKPKQRERSHS